MTCLLVVCDDAGYASIDRGIRHLVDETGVHVFADYLIETPGAVERAQELATHPLVSVGLHLELSNISDSQRVERSNELRQRGETLGMQPEIQRKAQEDARRQLAHFRDALGTDPLHIGTHGDFHIDAAGHILPWWCDLMHELFADNVPPLQHAIPIVRHNKYSWNLPATARNPLTPDEFSSELTRFAHEPRIEWVLHPAMPEAGDDDIDMLFSAQMRVRDGTSAITILRSGIVERIGYDIAA